MKKSVLLLVLLFSVAAQHAHCQSAKTRGTYLNFSYELQKVKFDGSDVEYKSDYAGAITVGRTFYLHKKPILGLIRLGIDWTFFDLNVGAFSTTAKEFDPYYSDHDDEYASEKVNLYKGEAAMHIGPSVTLSPLKGFNICGYYRYAPSYSAVYNDYEDGLSGSFASFYVAGVSVSYKVISIGLEARRGSAEYKLVSGEVYDPVSEDWVESSSKEKLKTTSSRLYLSFRF